MMFLIQTSKDIVLGCLSAVFSHKFWTYKFWRRLQLAVVTAVLSVGASLWLSAAVSASVSDRASVVSSALSGGEATVFNRTSSAYEEAPSNLSVQAQVDHDLGDAAFEEAFVMTPGLRNSGLGPVFNNSSCVGCHIRNGRGMPEAGQLLLRVSLPENGLPQRGVAPSIEQSVEQPLEPRADDSEFSLASLSMDAGGPAEATGTVLANRGLSVPDLGDQIQDFSVVGVEPEATVDILWAEQGGQYADGEPYRLRSPRFEVTLSHGEPLPEDTLISPRVPSPVHGMGLLEAIPEADILAIADPADLDRDGISGKANRVLNVETDELALGRFGWKASSPTLLQQSADAYLNDMGITSPMFPAEDGSTEIDEETLVAAAAYAQTLAVPARAKVEDVQVQRGEKLFEDASCTACHVASFKTGSHKYPALENQVIHPFTDLLLHDMGEGLADHRPDFEANGREWRTPALWGVGLAQTVLPYSGYLHDGRARTFAEAILWHGGEAEVSKQAFVEMSGDDRAALVQFLQSL